MTNLVEVKLPVMGINFKMPDEKDLSEGGEISYQPKFLVGHCLHAEIIKLFLKATGIKFYTG